ncbi:DUF4329 domain-containing protein [Chryseobacterium sp.]|uniref:DUF4329 domain-containing protein n=2 Tax=Chryseobacterium sp. TaxID=1871047 RepID=UPI0025B887E0|nr:DUF4329 domain-containing protein [Chryseobacterium sp.]
MEKLHAGCRKVFNVDPLADKYRKWTPYAFSGNIVINAVELEGLEPGVLFGSMDTAAENFGQQYNGTSINVNQEYGSTIYSSTTIVNGTSITLFAYSVPNVGTTGASVTPSPAPSGNTATGDIHTHAAYDVNYANNIFSGSTTGNNLTSTSGDVGDNNRTGLIGYVATPNGSLQKYDPSTGNITTLSTNLPSDPNDPARLNNVSPTPTPSISPLPPAPPVVIPPPPPPINPVNTPNSQSIPNNNQPVTTP